MKQIVLLGSTGSIGTQTIEVCLQHHYQIIGLSAGSNIRLLAEQARLLHPKTVCVAREDLRPDLQALLADTDISVTAGEEALCDLAATPCDVVLNAVVGMAGLPLTMAAIGAGNTLALANKESLVAGRELVMEAAKKNQVSILPVDSEHSAIFQCLQGCPEKSLQKIILTASGGPFFGKKREELTKVTVADALAHPNWSMGQKITVDSATLMNKGLEVIEACHLFDVSPDQIEVVVQRESIIHSAVELTDRSVIAQMGVPDMKIPIQYALTYPERMVCDVKPLDLISLGCITFAKPDTQTFRCLDLCVNAMRQGGILPGVANAANEEAVAMFLAGKIGFLEIADLVEEAMTKFSSLQIETVPGRMALYHEVRSFVHEKAASGHIIID